MTGVGTTPVPTGRRGWWIARQLMMVALGLAAIGLGASLLIHGVTLWLDSSAAPQVCSVLPGGDAITKSPPRLLCLSVGPWRDLAIPMTAAGGALVLFGLGLVPASVRAYKRQFWFRGGTWVRVRPAGSPDANRPWDCKDCYR